MYFTVLNKRKFLTGVAIVLCGVAAFITLFSTGAYAVFYGGNFRKLPIYYVKTDEKKVAISFDCAWGVDYTDKLLETMAAENVRCTFFAVEFWSKKYHIN